MFSFPHSKSCESLLRTWTQHRLEIAKAPAYTFGLIFTQRQDVFKVLARKALSEQMCEFKLCVPLCCLHRVHLLQLHMWVWASVCVFYFSRKSATLSTISHVLKCKVTEWVHKHMKTPAHLDSHCFSCGLSRGWNVTAATCGFHVFGVQFVIDFFQVLISKLLRFPWKMKDSVRSLLKATAGGWFQWSNWLDLFKFTLCNRLLKH